MCGPLKERPSCPGVHPLTINSSSIQESTRKKKELLEAEYEEIKSLIDEERRRAMAKIEEEEKKVTSKFIFTQSVLTKKRQEYEKMRSRVQSLLQENDDLQFLKVRTSTPSVIPLTCMISL